MNKQPYKRFHYFIQLTIRQVHVYLVDLASFTLPDIVSADTDSYYDNHHKNSGDQDGSHCHTDQNQHQEICRFTSIHTLM